MTTDAELDRMYEAAVADDWEEQNRDCPERESVNEAINKAVELLTKAAEILCGAVDEKSKLYDRISSYGSDLDDFVFALKGEVK